MFKSNLQADVAKLTNYNNYKKLQESHEELQEKHEKLQQCNKDVEEQLKDAQEQLIKYLQKKNNESEIEILLSEIPLEEEEEVKLLDKIKEVMVTVFSECEGPQLKNHLFLAIQEMIGELIIPMNNSSTQSEKEISKKIVYFLQQIVHAIIDNLTQEVKWVEEKNQFEKVCLVKIKPLDYLGIIKMELKPEKDEAYLDKQNRFIQMIFGIILDEANKHKDRLSLLRKCAQDLGLLSSHQNVSSSDTDLARFPDLSFQNQEDNTTDDSKAKSSSFSTTENPIPSPAALNVVEDNSNFFSFAPYTSLCRTKNELCITDIKLTKNTDHTENFACSFLVKYLPESQRYKFYADNFTSYSFINLMRASLSKSVKVFENEIKARQFIQKSYAKTSEAARKDEEATRKGKTQGFVSIAKDLDKEIINIGKTCKAECTQDKSGTLNGSALSTKFFNHCYQQMIENAINNLKSCDFGRFPDKYQKQFFKIKGVDYKIRTNENEFVKKQQQAIEKNIKKFEKKEQKIEELNPQKKEKHNTKLKITKQTIFDKFKKEQKNVYDKFAEERKKSFRTLEKLIYASKDCKKDQLKAKAEINQCRAQLNFLCDLNFFIVSHPEHEFEVSKEGMTAKHRLNS